MTHLLDSIMDSDINNFRQSLFIDALKKKGNASQKTIETHKVPFGNIEVRKFCNGCGMCAALFPVDAPLTAEVFRLKFKSAVCTGYGLCCQICPQHSIHMQAQIDLNEVLLMEEKTVVKIEKGRCLACGKFFVATVDPVLCPSCLKNKEIEDSYFGL